MGVYVKGYGQRVAMIIIALGAVLASSLFCYGLFYEKLNSISGQLKCYDSADYSTIYMLNYGEGFKNECLYPDTEIQFYNDAEKNNRLTVSCIMREEGVLYDLEYLAPLSQLNPGEVCISQNVANTYKLRIGDIIFAEYPYSQVPEQLTITAIKQTDYDYLHPNIDNAIGMVFLSFSEKYAVSTNGKYILFAKNSQAEKLAEYPQIIINVINKSKNSEIVATQSQGAMIFEAVFSLVAVVLAQLFFFSRSRMPLYRCYLKGMRKIYMSVIPLVERLIFSLLPCVLCQFIIMSNMPKSSVANTYQMIPICICSLFCAVMFCYETLQLKKEGE